MKTPRYLYHYTTLEKLALILKSHAIRFMPLDTMDDLEEKETKDLKNAGKFIFVSSWTSNENESIPMWSMYSSLENGVRIKLPFEPFVLYDMTVSDAAKLANRTREIINKEEVFRKSIVPIETVLSRMFFSPEMMYDIECDDKPIKVEYTNDKALLYPDVLIVENGVIQGINLGMIGKYKNTAWRFQDEWRHKFSVLPGSAFEVISNPEKYSETFKRICDGSLERPVNYVDRIIEDNAFREMSIVKSPIFSEGNNVLLESITQRYNPEMTIKESELKDKIR